MPINEINTSELINKTIPNDILQQLQVLGRVTFNPKPTTISSISTASTDEIDNTRLANDAVDHVGQMEDLASQIEDMIDQLTKDMSIPVPNDNDMLKNAVKSLDPTGDGSKITKDVFDKAQAIINHAPILINGYDPFLAALTGDGTVSGDYMDCDQVTRSVAKLWNTADPKSFTPEQPIKDETSKIANEYEKNLGKMILEILQMFFFNMLWPKYLVDLSIINPTRVLVANPLDSIICFFKDFKDKFGEKNGRFKIKTPDCLEVNGPLNKAVTAFRCYLLCVPPAKLWDIKKYKPMVEKFDCNCEKYNKKCPDKKIVNNLDSNSKMDKIMDAIFVDGKEPCVNVEDVLGKVDQSKNTGIGLPPECLKNAQVIMEAVIADALSPSDQSTVGITGSQGIGSQINLQVKDL